MSGKAPFPRRRLERTAGELFLIGAQEERRRERALFNPAAPDCISGLDRTLCAQAGSGQFLDLDPIP